MLQSKQIDITFGFLNKIYSRCNFSTIGDKLLKTCANYAAACSKETK